MIELRTRVRTAVDPADPLAETGEVVGLATYLSTDGQDCLGYAVRLDIPYRGSLLRPDGTMGPHISTILVHAESVVPI